MVVFSSASTSLLIFLLFTLFSSPTLAMRKLKDVEIETVRASLVRVAADKAKGIHLPRVKLHEVHSGPNPISNSLPQQNKQTSLQRSP